PPPTPSTQRPLTPPPPPLHDALPTWVRDPARAVDLLDTRLHVRVARDDDDLADGLGARGGCDRVEGDREGEPRAVGARELQARLSGLGGLHGNDDAPEHGIPSGEDRAGPRLPRRGALARHRGRTARGNRPGRAPDRGRRDG